MSIYSLVDNSSALTILDVDGGVYDCFYIHEFENELIKKHFRGMTWYRDRIYAVSTAGLHIFFFQEKINQIPFHLHRNVVRPEWLLGEENQGNLCSVHVSEKTNRLYLSYSACDAIDSFTLEGDYLERVYLWDMAPNLMKHMKRPRTSGVGYTFINHIFEDATGDLFLTLSSISSSGDNGAVLDMNSGEIVLEYSNRLHGGIVTPDSFYVCSNREGIVLRYSVHDGSLKNASNNPVQTYHPKIHDPKWLGSIQRTRGLLVRNNQVVSGVMHFGKPDPRQVPPRLVVFDQESGIQLKEIFLPQIEGLREPCIYSLCEVPQSWFDHLPPHHNPRYYRGQSTFDFSSEEIDPLSEPIEEEKYQQLEKEGKFEDIRGITDEEIDLLAKPIEEEGPQKLEIERASENIDVTTEMGLNFEEGKTIEKRLSIEFDDVSFCYYRRKLSLLRGSDRDKRFWAIQDISFQIYDTEMVGVVGRNGSGKSTTALLMAGVYEPDKGAVKTRGRVGLLALGTGFNSELTGLENIYINGAYLGHSRKYIKEKIEHIVDFSELGEFIRQPIKTYSTGMRSRLAFSIAAVMQPEILVIDEVMATGDQCFKAKAQERIKEMVESAKSVIIISHQTGLLKKLCNRVIWLDGGRVIMDGSPKEVLKAYTSYCKAPEQWLQKSLEDASKVQ